MNDEQHELVLILDHLQIASARIPPEAFDLSPAEFVERYLLVMAEVVIRSAKDAKP